MEISSYLSLFEFTNLANVCQEGAILQTLLRAEGMLWLMSTCCKLEWPKSVA